MGTSLLLPRIMGTRCLGVGTSKVHQEDIVIVGGGIGGLGFAGALHR